VKRVENGASIFGSEIPAADLIARVRTYSWKESLIRLSHLAAIVANSSGGPSSVAVRSRTVDALLDATGYPPSVQRIQSFVLQNRESMAIAHEAAISYLQHLVLVEGAEDGDAPGDTEIALWLLAMNDHLGDWEEPDSRKISRLEELIAETAHALRFNNFPDWLREMVRAYAIFSKPPARGPFAGTEAWTQLQKTAFGCAFEEYFVEFVFRLAATARVLGDGRDAHEGVPLDMIGRLVQIGLSRAGAQQWLEEISITREAAAHEIRARMRENGLPHAPTVLLRQPIVDCGEGQLICVSPWAVRGLLRSGIWHRYLTAAKKQCGSDTLGANKWLSTFGELFEAWCREIALHAKESPWFKAEVLLPSFPGAEDEIEDVVIVEGRAAVLFSAKARFVKERLARQAKSRTELLDWYWDFLFEKPTKKYRDGATDKHRGGAASLLSRRIDWIRAGKFEPKLGRNVRIIPVILTYDSLCEQWPLYRWMRDRCREEGVLQQKDVAPLTLARIEEFEELMRFAAEGESVVGILRKREKSFKDRRLDEVLFAMSTSRPKRLPLFDNMYQELFQKIEARLSTVSSDG
jgi:hypothetical protein